MRFTRTLSYLILLVFFLLCPSLVHSGLRPGVEGYDRGDYATALKELKPLADQGLAEAQFQLGMMYQYGRGLPKDLGKAANWVRLAAEQGHTEAQTHLGLMYENGIGVPKNYEEAERWLRLACPGCDIPDAKMMKFMKEGSTVSTYMDLDGDGQNELVKEVRGPGVSQHSLTIEVYKDSQLIGSIDPNQFGIQAMYKIADLDDDGGKEIITWSGLWDPRLPGEEGVTEETYEGHSSPHRYVFVTYKLIRGEYYPWNYYTTKKKYSPYFSWEGKEFPE